MISLLILIVLAWNFYIGYRRGIILQVSYFLASLISLVIANHNYQSLAEKITLWVPYSSAAEGVKVFFFKGVNIFELSHVYYAGVAFTAIYAVSYLLFRLLGIFLHFGPVDKYDNTKANLASGFLSVLVTLIFISMVFTVLATVPLASIQNLLSSSGLAKFLINHFPILSQYLEKVWVSNIL